MITIETYKNLNAGLPAQDNSFWNYINDLAKFVTDPSALPVDTFVRIMTLDRSIVFQMQAELSNLQVQSMQGDTVITWPATKNPENTQSVVLSRGDVLIEFGCSCALNSPLRTFLDQTIFSRLTEAAKGCVDPDTQVQLQDSGDSGKNIRLCIPNGNEPIDIKIVAEGSSVSTATQFYQTWKVSFLRDSAAYKKYVVEAIEHKEHDGIQAYGVLYTSDQFIKDIAAA